MMNRSYLSRLGALLVFTCIFALQTAAAGQNILYFNSEPGDYIGQGQEVFLTDSDVNFTARTNFDNGISLYMVNFQSFPFIWWYLDFAAPYSAPLAIGAYEGATRFPFQLDTNPGLSFYGQGRGCNTLTGRFDVREVIYGTLGEIVSFAADFEQHCEGREPALFGSIRFNSDVPVPTLIPGSISIENLLNSDLCVEAEGPDGARIFAIGSSTQDEGQIIYEWATATGELGTGKTFDFLVDVNESMMIELKITDTQTGESVITSKEVCVSDTQPPTISILNPVDGSVINIRNWLMEVQIFDLVDQEILNYELFIGQMSTMELIDGYSQYRSAIPDDSEYPTSIMVEATDASGNVAKASVDVIATRGAR